MSIGSWLRRHALFVALAVAALAVYLANTLTSEVRTGGPLAVGYGIAAASLLAAAAAYGVRRRTMRFSSRLRLGSASAWLGLHVYGGLLFLLLVLMHSGFGLPSGWVTWGLWLATWAIVAGGLVGWALQRWIPRQLASGLAIEAHYDRIPALVDELRARAEKLAAESGEPLQRLASTVVAPALTAPRREWLYLRDVSGGLQRRLKPFQRLRSLLPDDDRERLDRLAGIYRAKLELDCHYTLQSLLRGWLWLHAPLSMVLLGLFAVHLFSVLYW